MKKTLLQMVQSILSDMDSEDVNSISDSVEAQQVASIIEDTYYNLIASRKIPEHNQLLKLTSLSDSTKPTYFQYPSETKEIRKIYYNVDESSDLSFREIVFCDPIDFLQRAIGTGASFTTVTDPNGSTSFKVRNDAMPSFYTSFDDTHIVMDAHKSSVDTVLQESKTRCYGTLFPVFSITDSYIPDIDDNDKPYLLAEAKSVAFSILKAGADPKIEQAARRLKSYRQNDLFKSKRDTTRPRYGR